MPNYDFVCLNCETTAEKYFDFHQDHRVECERCGNAMNKVFQANPTHFKGGGWGGK